jgi:hypothetical protein
MNQPAEYYPNSRYSLRQNAWRVVGACNPRYGRGEKFEYSEQGRKFGLNVVQIIDPILRQSETLSKDCCISQSMIRYYARLCVGP